jgi:hypothetical protein
MKRKTTEVLDALRESWRTLRVGSPGRRFEEAYRARQRRRKGAAGFRWLVKATGILLVIAGLAIGWLPGPGGVVAVVGVALLATEFRGFALLLDRMELALRGLWRRAWKRASVARRALVVLGAATALASVALVAGRIFTP